MENRTRKLWDEQRRLVGDRRGLYAAVADVVAADQVLYPGSYVDLTPSFQWPSVTYVDVDRRAERFFSDRAGIDELLAEHDVDPDQAEVNFVAADYSDQLPLDDGSVDLLISLYAGFISEHCTRYLRPGGSLLVNSSHGDAAMASLDPGYRLQAVVESRSGRYRLRTDQLDTYLIPKKDVEITVESLHESGRGVAYTRSPFAYLFQRTT